MSYPGAQRVVTTLLNHGILIPIDERKYGRAYVAQGCSFRYLWQWPRKPNLTFLTNS